MASASSKIGALILTVPPILVGTAGLAIYKTDWRALLRSVVSGENARSRVVVLLFLLLNLKSLPLSWTVCPVSSTNTCVSRRKTLTCTTSFESSTPSSSTI
jgi:hypothetical protein